MMIAKMLLVPNPDSTTSARVRLEAHDVLAKSWAGLWGWIGELTNLVTKRKLIS